MTYQSTQTLRLQSFILVLFIFHDLPTIVTYLPNCNKVGHALLDVIFLYSGTKSKYISPYQKSFKLIEKEQYLLMLWFELFGFDIYLTLGKFTVKVKVMHLLQ